MPKNKNKSNKGRPVYPQIDISGLSNESKLNILKALSEEEEASAKEKEKAKSPAKV